ncbi:kinase-like domain-containing protein [Suillus spraguei]|nr:kinase-like domain-containing protein [Suillus spraguei]
MRVIIEQQVTSGVDYQCHFCGAVNRLGVETIMHLLELFQRQAGCSIDCQICKRQFHISRVPVSREQSPRRVPRGSLHDYLKRNHFNLSERQKSDILFEVADGVNYLHKQGIVHGNLTGDTIFCDDSGRVRIADDQIFSEQLPGDARYTAPEYIDHQIEASRPSKAGDIYSYGCVMILVRCGAK